MNKDIKPILVRLDQDMYERIKEKVGAPNGKFGSGVSGYIKQLLHEALGMDKPNYHDSKRGPRAKREETELSKLFDL